MIKDMQKISDHFFFQEGPGVRNTQYTTSGVKLLNVANLKEGKLDISNTDRYISEEEAYGKYAHFLVEEGDFIIASSGIKVEYFDEKMGFAKKEHLPLCMNTSTIRFRALNKEKVDIRYFMYFLKSNEFKSQLARQITGSAQLNFGPSHIKKMMFPLLGIKEQQRIVNILSHLDDLIDKCKMQISKFDDLVKSQFIEMFGDPIFNTKGLTAVRLGDISWLKSGKNVTSKDIHEQNVEFPYPCYGGNGIRGFVNKYSHEGAYCLIGRQGTLCGNVQIANGKFYPTEHAVVVNQTKNDNVIWLLYCLKFLDLNRLQTGAAQPGLNIEILENVRMPRPELEDQNDFARFVEQTDKSKFRAKQSLEKLEKCYKALLQKYFG